MFIAIAVAIYAMFWAIGMQASFGITLVYTLFLAYFTTLVLSCGPDLLTPPAVVIAVFAAYRVARGDLATILAVFRNRLKISLCGGHLGGRGHSTLQATRDRLEQKPGVAARGRGRKQPAANSRTRISRRLGICIAYVVGNGVSAALLMANVQARVRVFASESA